MLDCVSDTFWLVADDILVVTCSRRHFGCKLAPHRGRYALYCVSDGKGPVNGSTGRVGIIKWNK